MIKVPEINISGRRIAADEPTFVIAEIGVNHNGDIELAHRMIDAAKDAGADAVKFQTFKTEANILPEAKKAEYQSRSTGEGSQFDMVKKLELPFEDFAALNNHCRDVGIEFMSTAFDLESLEFVVSLNPFCLKWPSGELNNFALLRKANQSALPIMLSTGMGSLKEIAAALDVLGQDTPVVILQCVSNYPAQIEDQNLRVLPAMQAAFGRPVGFSDHTIGPYAALVAKALGMAVLEKHFTLDRSMEGPDHSASIEPHEFRQMVEILRKVETGLGDGIKRPVSSETNVKAVARKSLVYKNSFPAGHVIQENDLVGKRPGHGISPDQIDSFLGRVLIQSVIQNQLLSPVDFK